MEEEQPRQLNKYIEYIRTHKYTVSFVAAIVVIFILIIIMIVLITQQSTHKNASSSENNGSSQNTSGGPSSGSLPSGSIAPTLIIATPNPTEAATIDTQTQPQITPNVGVPYTVSNIKKYGDEWAIMTINNPDIGNAIVIVNKVNDSWKVVLGPGTNFTQDDLQSVGAPTAILNIAQPAPSESPTPSAYYDAQ